MTTKTVQLTTADKEQLREAIEDAKTYRNKKLKELTLMIIGVIAVGLIAGYWIGMLSWAIFLAALLFALIQLVMFSIGWYLAGRPIERIEKDLESGIKRTGTSEIKKISIFNRTIRLVDGTTVYEGDALYGKWRKGDKIFYQCTMSGQHIFECKREG